MEKEKIYSTLLKLKNLGEWSVILENRLSEIRDYLINKKFTYIKNQPHLKNSKISLEYLYGHPVIRIDNNTGYNYLFIFENEIILDYRWVGHCSGCSKPMFKKEKDLEGESFNTTYRYCEECYNRNNYKKFIL